MTADSRTNLLKAFDRSDLTPGEHLRAEIERLGLDQVTLSVSTGVSRQSINNIVNDRQPISRAMAGKLGRLTGRSSDYWLRSSFPPMPTTSSIETDVFNEEITIPRAVDAGILVNHQILRAIEDGVIVIEPFRKENIQLASIDLTLDDFIITTEGEKIDISDEQTFVLRGGRTVVVSTKEWVEFPTDYIGRVGAMTKLARFGLVISHGFQIDPGFKGNLQFCIFNAGGRDFELRGRYAIISLEIIRLNVSPTPDERALRQLIEAGDRQKVISIFRGGPGICDRLIRAAVRTKAKVKTEDDTSAASIAELNVEFTAPSADNALDAVEHGALSGLSILRGSPDTARDEREKFTIFFSELADRLHLNADQVREAVAYLGVPVEKNDGALMATLRDGKEAMVYLPTKSATISLKRLARQLREDPSDLILILVGLRNYPDREMSFRAHKKAI
jgi:deoxycytidine triphosphate deaminase/addiction module HigA family antidote